MARDRDMRTTRQRILQIIQRRRSETVGGLAKELTLAPATVRRHLDILQRDGLVAFSEVRKGTGRPEHSFSLTDRGHETLPKAYDSLLSALVRQLAGMDAQALAGKDGAQALEAVLTRLGRDVARQYVDASREGSSGAQSRLAAALKALRDRDFEPEAVADTAMTRILLNNCPFRSAALADDAICSYDRAILQTILGSEVRRERCLNRGDDCCEYAAETLMPVLAESGRSGPKGPVDGEDVAVDADVGHA